MLINRALYFKNKWPRNIVGLRQLSDNWEKKVRDHDNLPANLINSEERTHELEVKKEKSGGGLGVG